MDTPVHPARPGMPPIEPTPEPEQAGIEQPGQASVEPGIGDASDGAGAAFVANLIDKAQMDPVVPPQMPMRPQFPDGTPPVQAGQVQPPVAAEAPEGQPSNLDFGGRYGAGASAPQVPDPLPELPPEPVVQTPENLGEQQNHAFAAMRAAMNASRRAAEEYRAKYNEVVAATKKFQDEKTEFANQLNVKDKRIEELTAEIGKTDLSRSPEFQAKYDAPITGIRDQVSQILVANGMDQDQAVDLSSQILQSQASEVPALVANLPTHVQGMIMIHAQNADKLWAERDLALENWRQSAEGLAAAASRGSAIVNAQHVSQMAEKAIGIVKSMPVDKGSVPAYQVTDPTFSADRDAKEQQFRSWIQQAPEEQKYAAMFEGFMAPKTYEMLQQTWLENQRLKEFITTRMRIAVPPVSAAHAVPPMPPAPPPQPVVPTVSENGFSRADGGVSAQGFAEGLINEMLSGGQPMP